MANVPRQVAGSTGAMDGITEVPAPHDALADGSTI
jgi:hypothetical protein